MEIVPVDQIPVAGPTPVENLMDLYKVCQKMETLCRKQNGIGLAAVQVGLPWKLFIYRKPDGSFVYMVDCEYEPIEEEKAVSIEGCLSLRRVDGSLRHFQVDRYRKVRVTGSQLVVDDNLRLEPVDLIEADNIYSVVLQHEIDHQRNVLISDFGEEIEIRR